MNERDFRIRVANDDDVTDVQSCVLAAYAKYVRRIGKEPAPIKADYTSEIKSGCVYVALSGDEIVGCVTFSAREDHLYLQNLAVIPTHSGNGYGKKLIQFVEETALRQGLKAVELYTNEAMSENLAMYPKLGYVETERREQDGYKRVFFRKSR